ncbi:hypothetical protein BDZ89DRAFT_1138182 [Hymenopellis radicata]|nr:hypothetical protein BDZ89DRAFT_1138182 [Hymenopellis radicata]
MFPLTFPPPAAYKKQLEILQQLQMARAKSRPLSIILHLSSRQSLLTSSVSYLTSPLTQSKSARAGGSDGSSQELEIRKPIDLHVFLVLLESVSTLQALKVFQVLESRHDEGIDSPEMNYFDTLSTLHVTWAEFQQSDTMFSCITLPALRHLNISYPLGLPFARHCRFVSDIIRPPLIVWAPILGIPIPIYPRLRYVSVGHPQRPVTPTLPPGRQKPNASD